MGNNQNGHKLNFFADNFDFIKSLKNDKFKIILINLKLVVIMLKSKYPDKDSILSELSHLFPFHFFIWTVE